MTSITLERSRRSSWQCAQAVPSASGERQITETSYSNDAWFRRRFLLWLFSCLCQSSNHSMLTHALLLSLGQLEVPHCCRVRLRFLTYLYVSTLYLRSSTHRR